MWRIRQQKANELSLGSQAFTQHRMYFLLPIDIIHAFKSIP
jgi:hypothetical protein